VDFDGVLNNYTGYDPHNLFTPRRGVEDFLKELSKEYNIIIFSTRNSSDIVKWLEKYHLSKYIHRVTNIKPPAVVYIDDRGLRFNGD
jgi:FMN phosphatase YigB (HAD superfamily)